ncbi:AT-hook motif nuclear-localized protein 10 isoform X2 [Amaranthus tricolor]|uniref:AT-hook motif nuclear-localized protein 10 isoform X2 n=1 Tax=Amaranthus tricolor TaxID=29722 RepID=UPI002583ED80|nr:AT-hook motif nuclear-localized protein 10 isoform X2 [Amaranthus tricolor]
MSGSELGLMDNIGMQKSPVIMSQPGVHSMQISFGADGNPVYKPVTGNGNGEGMNINMTMGEPLKKKRGRPRKYAPEGSAPPPVHVTKNQPCSGGFSLSRQQLSEVIPAQHQVQRQHQPTPPPLHTVSVEVGSSPSKKGRGRPLGSGKKNQMDAVGGSPGIGFTPHVITVNAGEDVASRIMSFSQSGPRAICILSAIGTISNVTIRQSATCGGSVTYEGRFEILSLSGSFMLADSGGPQSRSGGLSVSLAGSDGRVFGGGVAGLLIAESPVIVGSFIAENRREQKIGNLTEPFTPGRPHAAAGPTGPSSPTSRGTLSESSGGPGSPLNQSTGAVTSVDMSSLPWK